MRDRPLIAVVDDDASVCRALNRLLRSARMDAETFGSASEFLEAGEHHDPDCLILDVQMPGMTGIELHDRLAARNSAIPVILITAYETAGITNAQPTCRPVACLRKPFSDRCLMDAIAQALRTRYAHCPNAGENDDGR